MYCAALYCEDCGEDIRKQLDAEGKAPADRDDESSFDSDQYPKGPYGDGGGEADTPQHCDSCGLFLENPLTPDGDAYVREKAKEYTTRPDMAWSDIAEIAEQRGSAVLAEWIIFYLAWGQ